IWKDGGQNGRDQEIQHKQNLGDALRSTLQRDDALAICAVKEIHRLRAVETKAADKPRPRHAYIIRQLKTPGEVAALRRIYGDGFILIGLYSKKGNRINRL